MRKAFKILLAGLSGLITFTFLALTIQRLRWDYNEMGNHFDEDSATNYTDGAVIGYSALTILFLLPTILIVRNILKQWRSSECYRRL